MAMALYHDAGATARVSAGLVRAAPTTSYVIRDISERMTMLSFRVPDDEAVEAQRWAETLGVDRSELLRESLHRHLVGLRGEQDASKWDESPATADELSLAAIADWGPAEDWADWNSAAR